MKLIRRLLISLYTAFIVFAWLSFFLGPNGLKETRQLQEYKNKLVEGNARMEEINRKLESEFKGLESDPEIIAMEARRLGYYRDNEGVFFLEGYLPDRKGYSVGALYREYSGKTAGIELLRTIAVMFGAVVFFFLTLFTRNKNVDPVRRIRRKRYSEIYYN